MRTLWTDGSASPNPGPGGFAVIENGQPVVLGREAKTSNIRMEGKALIAAFELLNGEEGEIYTDSEFWVNVVTKWAAGWKNNNWKKADKKEIQNLDLVQELFMKFVLGNARLKWTQGHVGTEMNELADEWANKAREGATI